MLSMALAMAIQGTYTVRAPAHLAPIASFAIEYAVDSDGAGNTRLRYQLPEEIVGPGKPPIELTQSGPAVDGKVPFAGALGHGTCARAAAELSCYIDYPGLDTRGAEELVRQRYADSAELGARLELAQTFGADPKGSLRLRLN
jgi:hypothetical protein